MRRALALARRGEGRVEPNPMVGCVITRGRRILGEGYHRRFGGAHAEIEALRSCEGSPRGATVFVSLEPCAHFGKTPPCCDALIESGVRRVVAAARDPHPRVGGRGLQKLRAAGIAVETGLCEPEAKELLAPFETRIRLHRPYVIAKWAQSLDGRLAASSGDSQWISCETSRRQVHRLRARVDAILVGSGTVLQDDPLLTARGVPIRRRALRVVLDGRLRTPENCQLVVTASDVPTLLLTAHKRASSPKADRLRRRGVDLVACRSGGGRIQVADALQILVHRDVTNLLVEGGPRVLGSFLNARRVDEAFVYTAPLLIGGQAGHGVVEFLGTANVADAAPFRKATVRRSGADVLHHLRFT